MRKFVDDFDWVARLDERVDGSAHMTVVTADNAVIWDRDFPDAETALVRFRRAFPRFQEVA